MDPTGRVPAGRRSRSVLDDEVDQSAETEGYEGYDRGERGPHLQIRFRIYLEEAAY